MELASVSTAKPLFIEMAELSSKDGTSSQAWREVVRWVKYEEDIEDGGGQRWSKPYVPTIELKALKNLRQVLGTSVIRLNFDCNSEEKACRTLVDVWVVQEMITEVERSYVLQSLLRSHVHFYETAWSFKKASVFRKTKSKKKQKQETPVTLAGRGRPQVLRRSSVCSVVYVDSSKEDKEKNVQFLRKIPENAESANIMVGQLNCLKQPLAAFLRFEEPRVLGNLTEVPLPTRFIFILLTPPGLDHFQMGRCMGTLLTDQAFKTLAYQATTREKLLQAIDIYADTVLLLPPSIWDNSIRLEPPTKSESSNHHGGESSYSHLDPSLQRTGRLFGGLLNDVRRKGPWYWSDFKDALTIQCVATWLFLYFACLTPMITFGGLMGKATNGGMGTIETMLSGCVCGIVFALFSGQPLTILGSTGPMLVFEKILVAFAGSYGLNYMEFRLWVGLWIAGILVILVATDASSLVSYITRFTEDNFATLIACIFIVEAVKNVLEIQNLRINPYGDHTNYTNGSVISILDEDPESGYAWNWDYEVDHETLTSPVSNSSTPFLFLWHNLTTESSQSIFLMSLLLFIGTFSISYMLKEFRVSPFFPTSFRFLVSDFAVIIAIICMTWVDYLVDIPTPKLSVPETFSPTSDSREWFIPPFERNPFWSVFAAAVPAALASILIFMDQQITAVIVNRKDHKLKKGCGYHLDLFVLSLLIALASFFGLPWFVAATVESLTNLGSLKMESESAAPGEKPAFLGVREQRVSNIFVFTTIGMSVLLTPILVLVPMPVLYGVFLFMGFSALMKMDLFLRVRLFFIPLKYQPDVPYLRRVPLRRVHLFTCIQLLCLGLLWIIKSTKSTAIAFPLMLIVMMVVRRLLAFVFSPRELLALDDPLPGSKREVEMEINGKYKSVTQIEV